jgi:urate oxidase
MSVSARVRVLSTAFAAILLTSTSSAFAQAVYGSIFGSVTDASSAVIPNATVIVEDPSKGTSTTVTSNASGEFTVDHLIPDVYNVKVTAQGFQGYQQSGIQIFADTSTKLQITMQIGAAETTVEVSAD